MIPILVMEQHPFAGWVLKSATSHKWTTTVVNLTQYLARKKYIYLGCSDKQVVSELKETNNSLSPSIDTEVLPLSNHKPLIDDT